jgi:hypothetical protein
MFPPFGVTDMPPPPDFTSINAIRGLVLAVPVSLKIISASMLLPVTLENVTSAASNVPLVIVLEASVAAVPTKAEDALDQYSCAVLYV